MEHKITIIGGSGFVGTNLCRQLSLKQQDFEIIDLKMSNQFPEKCKIADVRDIDTLRQTISGAVVVNLAAVHRDDVRDKSEYHRTNDPYATKAIAQAYAQQHSALELHYKALADAEKRRRISIEFLYSMQDRRARARIADAEVIG